MHTRRFAVTFGLAGMIGVAGVAAGQHERHEAGADLTQSGAQVAQCRQAQPVVTGLLEAALTRLEEARLTNSAAAMRDAADDVQSALVDVRAQLGPCGEMQPASAPGRPGPPAPAPGNVPPHDGHATPAAPSPPAAPASVAPAARPPAAVRQSPAPSAADPHAGHVTPAAPAGRRPSPSAARPPTGAPPGAPAADAHAGHATAPDISSPPTPPDSGRGAAPAPPASIADLKCTNAVDAKTAPRMLYRGRMYYFCTEASRAEFAKDPAKFVTAPPQAAPAHGH